MTTFRDSLRPRFAALAIIVLVVLGVLLARLWSMQVIAGATYASQAEGNRIREVSIEAPRGRILDRKGRPLVTNRPALAVTATRDVLARGDVVSRLAALLGMTEPAVRARVGDKRYEPLQPRLVSIDVTMPAVAYISEHASQFPGVAVEVVPVRQYPHGSLAAHVLGYTGEISDSQLASQTTGDYRLGDIVGKTGVEAEFEKALRGDRGYKRFEVDATGKQRGGAIATRDPIPGRDIKLTIDIDTQRIAEKALADAMTDAHRAKYPKARAGAIVVLDVKTGEVLAMASAPTYDPSMFLGGVSQAKWRSLNASSSEFPLNNRAIMSAYPPASTFKAVTGLAGLRYGVTTPSTTYDCKGRWIGMGTQWPKWCWDHAGHGVISFVSGIRESCDTVFYEIGYSFYKRKGELLQKFARTLGLGSRTGIDLPGEVAGRVPDAAWKAAFNENYPEMRRWLPGDTVNMAIGQGDLLLTPLQLTSVFATIGNNGEVMRPHVLGSVLNVDGSTALRQAPKITGKADSTPAELAIMRDALVAVTTDGTGKAAFAGFPMKVAGKTGTAQVYGKDDYAWFACFAPADSPRYAVAVVVEQGGHGGSVAAPAARQVLAQLAGLPVEHVHATDQSR